MLAMLDRLSTLFCALTHTAAALLPARLHPFYQRQPRHLRALRDLLRSYSLFNMDVGYCQACVCVDIDCPDVVGQGR